MFGKHFFPAGLWTGIMLIVFSWNVTAQQQVERSELRTPGLVVETGFPMTQTRVLFFSRDSQTLFAAGLDKVVREWSLVNGRPDLSSLKTHRWAIYREQRGCIFCTALSHDAEQRFLAVAGFGLRNGSVAILDRASGQVVYALKRPRSDANVLSMAFAAGSDSLLIGRSDGTVAVWHYRQPDDVVVESASLPAGTVNPTLAIAEQSPGRFISVAEDDTVMLWNFQLGQVRGEKLTPFQFQTIYLAAVSSNNRFCAVLGLNKSDKKSYVKVRDFQRSVPVDVTLTFPEGLTTTRAVSALAFSNDGRSLFVALERENGSFELHRFDRDNQGQFNFVLTVPVAHKIESLAVSPSNELLFLANDRNELRLMDIRRNVWTDQLSGTGQRVEQVAFSRDGTQFGFRSGENTAWRVFDIPAQNWAKPDPSKPFIPVTRITSLARWRVEKDPADIRIWHVRDTQTGREYRIPTRPEIDLVPQCHLFLEPTSGATGIRFIIGHQWGASLFELQPGRGIRLIRRFVGHQGEVLCMGISPGNTRLITGSRDGTVSVWDLTPWPYQEELGADFELRNNRLFVRNIAEGSPAWEAQLQPGDEIVRFAYDGQYQETPLQQWHNILKTPEPGREIAFHLRRAGTEVVDVTLTTTRQRPLWRFFADRNDEWVLWRWRDYYYDCSLSGDSLIGWQINGDVDETPIFTTAEQSRHRFHSPELVAEMLASTLGLIAVQRIDVAELATPQIELNVVKNTDDQGLDVTISIPAPQQGQLGGAVPREEVLREVWLWLNDHKVKIWNDQRYPFSETFKIPAEDLRAGENHLLAQAYSGHMIRGDSKTDNIDSGKPTPQNAEQHRLYGLCVGVSNYRDARNVKDLLYCRADAEALKDVLEIQELLGVFQRSAIEMLGDRDVTQEKIAEIMAEVAEQVQPDDVFLLFLAGHGWAKKISLKSTLVEPGTFVFATAYFNEQNPDATGLRFYQKPQAGSDSADNTLYDLLAKIPCHKIVILDCCRGGSIVSDLSNRTNDEMLRSLFPEGVGPMVFTACDKDEDSFESRKNQHGFFTTVILEAFYGRNKITEEAMITIDIKDIEEWVRKRVPVLLDEEREDLQKLGVSNVKQNPQFYFPKKGDNTIIPKHIKFGVPGR